MNDRENLLIKGDNLDVLQKLLKTHRETIDLVYIDPPFATNTDFRIGTGRAATVSSSKSDKIAFSDKLRGNDYLDFLRERLILIRELMSPRGSIYLHIDCKIGHYVKILLDEAFGMENFRNDITRVKSNPKNFSRNAYGNIKDMILFYSKTREIIWNDVRKPYSDDDVKKLYRKRDENGRAYTTIPLHAPGASGGGATSREWRGIKPPAGRHWRTSPDILDEWDKQGLIEWSDSGVPRKKIFANMQNGKKIQDVWNFKDPAYPVYPTEKNHEMLSLIIKNSSNEGSLVMDCFAGSGAFLLEAEKLGRKWVGVDESAEAMKVIEDRMKGTEYVLSRQEKR
jgi:adenine-specific DNA-methyltransferase